MSSNKPLICILEIHEQYKVPQKEAWQNAALHQMLTGRFSFREKAKNSPLIMTRKKKDQDVLLFKIRLGREEAEISLIHTAWVWNAHGIIPFQKPGKAQ